MIGSGMKDDGINQKLRTCQARQYSDQMVCGPCRLSWDTNDPEPPVCPRTGDLGRSSGTP